MLLVVSNEATQSVLDIIVSIYVLNNDFWIQ
jgi:hypothetical protein